MFHCLRLCEGRSKKIFNFVSTLSASSVIDADGNVREEPPADTPPIYIRNGYNLSKWVAERILQRAREQGVWANLYRPGNITFNSRTGVCQPHRNRLMLMLKGSLQLGQVPALSLNFDLMPVDFLARFLAFHSSRYQARPRRVQPAQPRTVELGQLRARRSARRGATSSWSAWPSGNSGWAGWTPTTRCSACWASTSTASKKT